jgi:hypothetical protein
VADLGLVACGLALMRLRGGRLLLDRPAARPARRVPGHRPVNPALAALAMGSVSAQRSGLAAGVKDAFRQTGVAVSVAAYGALVPASAALGRGSPQSYVTGMHHAMYLSVAVAAVGAIASGALLIGRRRESTAAPEFSPDPA